MDDCINECAGQNAQHAPNLTCPFVHWEYDDYQRSGGWAVQCGLMRMAPFDWIIEGSDEAAILVAYNPTGNAQN
jgi:hypothetical protein